MEYVQYFLYVDDPPTGLADLLLKVPLFLRKDGKLQLSQADVVSWTARMVSITWEVVVVLSAFHMLWCEEAVSSDVIRGRSLLPQKMLVIECAYLMYDTMIELCKGTLEWRIGGRFLGGGRIGLLLHHAVFATMTGAYYAYGYGDFFIALASLTAASTPFLHFRWYLQKVQAMQKGSDGATWLQALYAANGSVLIAVTFVVRVLLFPWYGIYRAGVLQRRGMVAILTSMRAECIVSTVVVAGMNMYWFGLMCSKAFLYLAKNRSKVE